MVQIQVVSLIDCSSAWIFVLSATGPGWGAERKVAGVGDSAEGQRFVSFPKKGQKLRKRKLYSMKGFYLKLDE